MSDAHRVGSVVSDGAAVQRALGWGVIGSLAYFVTILAVLHGLRPDVDAVASVTSEYAVGPYGVLMTSAYFILALALASLGLALARALPASPRLSAGVGLLFVAAVAVGVAGFFPVDVGAARPVTPTGWVHRVAAVFAFASMTMAPLVLAGRFRREPGWGAVARVGVVVGVLGVLGFVAIQLLFLERGLAGAAQRIILALVVTWMAVAALRVTAGER